MFESLSGFIFQLTYIFSNITVSNVIDILLVAAVFFVILQALHRTRALQLMGGVIILAVFVATLLLLLPFDTLSWLLRWTLIAGAIALPLIFQDELRRVLTGISQLGRRRGYGTNFDRFKETIITSVQQLSTQKLGALIVLEGQTLLDDIIETGISLNADEVTPELLLSIFNPKTPLHDGAVVLRGDRLVAASCILPVQTESTGPIHMGTRHRAALGLSAKYPDALVIIVSEETSRVSVVLEGHFYRGISYEQVEKALNRFRDQLAGSGDMRWRWLRGGGLYPTIRNLLLSLTLAIIAWVSVIYQTNPPQLHTVSGVPLVISGPDSGLVIMSELPETVNVGLQTSQDLAAAIDVSSVRAELPLVGLEDGVHYVQVDVALADQRSQLTSVTPSFVNVTLEQDLSVELTPTLTILDLESLSPGYSVEGVALSPETVIVRGPKSSVEKISEALIELELEGSRTDFQKSISPILLDSDGEVVSDLRPTPEQVLVTVSIRRDFFTREIAVQADVREDTLEEGYEIERVQVSPSSVTISGSRTALDNAGDFLLTAPISLTNVLSEVTIDTPLILPEGATAMDAEGENVNNASVFIRVMPITSYLVLNSQVNVLNVPDPYFARVTPNRISVLAIGPQPLLDAIEEDNDLVIVFVDLSGYTAGVYDVVLQVQMPLGLQVQMFPSEVQVELVEPQPVE
jgi:diadenylate cyclase